MSPRDAVEQFDQQIQHGTAIFLLFHDPNVSKKPTLRLGTAVEAQSEVIGHGKLLFDGPTHTLFVAKQRLCRASVVIERRPGEGQVRLTGNFRLEGSSSKFIDTSLPLPLLSDCIKDSVTVTRLCTGLLGLVYV